MDMDIDGWIGGYGIYGIHMCEMHIYDINMVYLFILPILICIYMYYLCIVYIFNILRISCMCLVYVCMWCIVVWCVYVGVCLRACGGVWVCMCVCVRVCVGAASFAGGAER